MSESENLLITAMGLLECALEEPLETERMGLVYAAHEHVQRAWLLNFKQGEPPPISEAAKVVTRRFLPSSVGSL